MSDAASSRESTLDSALRDAASTSLSDDVGGAPFESARFDLVRELGRGGFGIVYEAVDRGLADSPVVALKILRRPHADRLYRFKREFRDLAEVRHENLVPLYELFASGPDVFFTMERIEGRSPIAHVGGRPEQARDVLRQLTRAIDALHAAGKLHRDIKPSNILVQPTGRVVVLDFGLAIDLDASGTRGSSELAGSRAGTPLYMSPEQCAELPLEEASDWYAVGTVLFEALTGRTPFEGTVEELLAAKTTEAAPRARELVPDLPEDLDDLCAALLARDPAARPGAREILRRLDGDPTTTPEARTRREPFVGRDREKAELLRLFERAAAGERTVALIAGASGIGKSALLRRFLDDVRERRPDSMILSGRCFELESVPYKALDAVVDELAQELRRLSTTDADALTPRDASALTTLFPVLRDAFARHGETRPQTTSAAELRARGVRALGELFARLAERRPLVVCVDDLQWGDVDSAALLVELIGTSNPPAICWVMTFREAESTTSPLLARVTALRETTLADVPIYDLPLVGLSHEESAELAAALLAETVEAGGEPHVDPRAIAIESQGNPFFVRELTRAGGGGHNIGGLVRGRVGALHGAARRVIDVVAVAGQPLELDVVAACSEARLELRDALASLRAEHLVRSRDGAQEKLLECYHDRIRETVVGSLTPTARAAIHLSLATALETHGSTDAAQIGRHLAEGGEPTRAQGYLTRAAREAADALAFEDAADLYRRALELAPSIAVEEAYAEVLSAAGHGPEAARIWLSLVDRVDGARRIELRRRATEDLLVAGQVDEGFTSMNALLAELDLSVPRGPLSAIARIAVNRVNQAVFGLGLRERRDKASDRELLRVDSLAGLSWSAVQLDPLIGYAIQTQHLRLALRSGDRQRAAYALWLEAPVRAVQGSRSAPYTRAILDAARAMTEGLDETQVSSGVFGTVEASVALHEGRFRDALRLVEGAEIAPNLNIIGHGSLRGLMYVTRAASLYWMGRAGEVLAMLPSQLRDMEEQNNLYAWLWLKLLEAWALSCTGDLKGAWAANEGAAARLPKGVFQLHHWYLASGQVKFLLLEGEVEEAWRRLEEVRRRFRFTLLGQVQRASGRWVRASVALARAAASKSARSAMLAEARREVAKLEGERAPWVDAIAASLRASIAYVAGDREDAMSLLAAAEPGLEAAHLHSLLAVARLQRGRRLGGARGSAEEERAEAWLNEHRVVPAVSRVLLAGWES